MVVSSNTHNGARDIGTQGLATSWPREITACPVVSSLATTSCKLQTKQTFNLEIGKRNFWVVFQYSAGADLLTHRPSYNPIQAEGNIDFYP